MTDAGGVLLVIGFIFTSNGIYMQYRSNKTDHSFANRYQPSIAATVASRNLHQVFNIDAGFIICIQILCFIYKCTLVSQILQSESSYAKERRTRELQWIEMEERSIGKPENTRNSSSSNRQTLRSIRRNKTSLQSFRPNQHKGKFSII